MVWYPWRPSIDSIDRWIDRLVRSILFSKKRKTMKKPLLEELIFQDFQNTRNVSILGPNALSAGVGLKSLDYELMGGNPEHGKRSAQKVNIVFWLESLKALTDNTSGPAFVDLISDPSTKLRTMTISKISVLLS